ncbi:MAG: lactate utilization protein [Marinifilaceae bacterium]
MPSEQQIQNCVEQLKRNRFEVYRVETEAEAHTLFIEQILPTLKFETFSWGDSRTMKATGVLETLKADETKCVITTFGPTMTRAEKIYWRREALTADLFLTGSNAVTEKGQLVNLDMVGNRVGALTFGPKQVVLFIGTNKIVPTLDDAIERVRSIAAPMNAALHTNLNTPCQKTGKCMDCNSVDRICNVWTIHDKCFPAGRIKIVLINRELGL